MKRNTSIALINYFEGFVENRISEGRYKKASEVFRAGWGLLKEEEKRVIALKNAESDVGKTLIQRTLLNLIKSQQANKQLSSFCQIIH